MQHSPPAVRDLVLAGGGHSHVQVLRYFGMHPVPGVRITLVSDGFAAPYSGMLPGCVGGDYAPEDIHINLDNLANFAQARFVCARINGLDPFAKQLHLVGRPSLRYDFLSINCGATPQVDAGLAAWLEQADATIPTVFAKTDTDQPQNHFESTQTRHMVAKPIGDFLAGFTYLQKALSGGGASVGQPAASASASASAQTRPQSVAVIGAGAGGLELVLALRQRLPAQVSLMLVGQQLLPDHSPATRRIATRLLAEKSISLRAARARVGAAGELLLDDQAGPAAVAWALWVTSVRAPEWLRDSGLTLDERGFISVDAQLRSLAFDDIYAAGDVAHLSAQERPKAGVYAVRAGPVLARNLAHVVQAEPSSRPPQRYLAQRHHLNLIGCGDGTAIASRGRFAQRSRFWWRLKQRIDRRFVAQFNELSSMADTAVTLPATLRADLPDDLMRCGGCGAKLAADPLRRVLARLPVQEHSWVRLGLGDDAAEIVNGGPSTLLTVDGFRAMISDPYRFGRIATHHALNDIFAMGATPLAALALVTVPLMSAAMMEEDLYQLMRGIVDVLTDHDVALAGGHTAEGAELSLGLTVMGKQGRVILAKGSCAADECLILTKPLGTGLVLAAAMRGQVAPGDMRDCLRQMDQSNAQGRDILCGHGASAMTDVTGFGLLGHLHEMLSPGRFGVTLDLTAVPCLAGALQAAQTGVRSSLHEGNSSALIDYAGSDDSDPLLALLVDPQTSGGLLATVPATKAAACLEDLRAAGYAQAQAIGIVTAGPERRFSRCLP